MSLSKRLFVRFVSLIIVSLAVLFLLMAYMDYRSFTASIQGFQGNLLTTYRDLVKAETQSAVSFVTLENSRTIDGLKDELRRHVDEANNILWNIYSKYRETKNTDELKKIAAEALRPIRFMGGRGYYFAFTMEGFIDLNPLNPSIEGHHDLGTINAEGRNIVVEMLDLVRNRKEGYLEYLWPKLNHPGETFRKLSYVKYFAPFDWVLGAGEYLDDREKASKRKVLEYLESITYGDTGYIFAGTYDGISLLGPQKGSSTLDQQDRDGRYIVRQLIATARQGGGFVSYQTPEHDGGRNLEISYVQGVDSWKWYIGASIHPVSVQERFAENKRQARQMLLLKFGYFFALSTLVLGISLWLSRRFAKSLGHELGLFNNFLESVQYDIAPMDLAPLKYDEFRSLARALNSMVERVAEAEAELKRSLVEKDTLLKEIHHRVKNNLQIVSSLLHLQVGKIADPAALQVLRDSSQRVMSMSQVHEQLYHSNNLGSIDIRLYVTNLWAGLCRSMGNRPSVALEVEGGPLELPLYKAVPCGLILNELLTNVLKHGFSDLDSKGRVNVTLKRVGDNVVISISDNGKGLPKDKDIHDVGGLGLQLVVNLTAQLGGEVEWYYDSEGFTVKITFSLHAV